MQTLVANEQRVPVETPTLRMMTAVTCAYEYLSANLFRVMIGEEPPAPLITLSRHPQALGFFVSDLWSDGDAKKYSELALTPLALASSDLRHTMSILVHEMAHALDYAQRVAAGRPLRTKGYHSKSWCAIMEKLGLPPRPISTTMLRVSHDIAEDGAFARVFAAMPPELLLPLSALSHEMPRRAKGKAGRRFMYRCPSCGLPVRGPSGRKLACLDCNALLIESSRP